MGERTMRKIGAREATNRLGALLDLVEHGEEIIVTRQGKARRLTPAAVGWVEPQAKPIVPG
jgi:prevent-host-death family protein